VAERGTPEVFRLDPTQTEPDGIDAQIYETLMEFKGLPFARRQLRQFDARLVQLTLDRLRLRGDLTSYPPLVERGGRPVAQAEHTLYLGPDGTEVLTA
jgi:methionine aminopeptidase